MSLPVIREHTQVLPYTKFDFLSFSDPDGKPYLIVKSHDAFPNILFLIYCDL